MTNTAEAVLNIFPKEIGLDTSYELFLIEMSYRQCRILFFWVKITNLLSDDFVQTDYC